MFNNRLKIWGPVMGTSGYAKHTTGLCTGLHDLAPQLIIEPLELTPDWRARVPEKLHAAIERGMQANQNYDGVVAITLPTALAFKKSELKPLYPFVVFEGDRMMRSWEPYFDFSNGFLFPSTHSERAFRASYPNQEGKPGTVVPHGVDLNVFKAEGPKIPQLATPEFKFLFVGGWKDYERDRKGLDILLRAFCAEFKQGEPVECVVKINTAYSSPEAVMHDLARLALPDKTQRAKITLLFDALTDLQMAELYRSCNVVVQPSKAEAFCLPILEGMACGLPAIATDYGGQTDYLTNAEGWRLPIEGMEPATGEAWMYQDTQWAKPNPTALRGLMREAYDGKDDAVISKGKAASEKALEYSWEHSALLLSQAVEKWATT